MRRDLIYTYIVEGLVVCSFFAVFKIVYGRFGTEEFSLYAIARRAVSFTLSVSLVGFSTALPRYIAIANASGEGKQSSYYFTSSLYFFTLSSLLIFVTSIVYGPILSDLIFGSPQFVSMVMPVAVLVASLGLYSLIYGYLRGNLMIRVANGYKLAVMGTFPILACFLATSISEQIFINGFMVFLCSIILLIYIKCPLDNPKLLGHCFKDLFSYGARRIPGDLTMAGILLLPVIFISNVYGLREAGFFAFGITLINIVISSLSPIGLILLPNISKFLAEKRFKDIKTIILKVNLFSIISGVMFLISFQLLIPYLMNAFFGESDPVLERILRIVSLTSVFLAPFICNRSIFDAAYSKAINARNIIISGLFLSIGLASIYLLNLNVYHVAVIFVLTYAILFFLSIIVLRNLLKNSLI